MANCLMQERCQAIRREKMLGKRIDDETVQLGFGNCSRAVAGRSPFEPVGGTRVIAVGASAFAGSGPKHHRTTATLAADNAGEEHVTRRDPCGRGPGVPRMQA